MKPELIESLRMCWQRRRIYRRSCTVLVGYRFLRNFIRICLIVGAAA